MKKIAGPAASLVLALAVAVLVIQGSLFNAGAQDGKNPPAVPDKPRDLSTAQRKTGYAFGYNLGVKLKHDLDLVDLESLLDGIREGAAGAEPRMTDDEIKAELGKFNSETNKRASERMIKAAEKFLAENAKKEGVKVTASGLQYKVLTVGTGKKPLANSIVTVHYEGKLLDGTVFDSTYERGQPAQFPLNRLIPGWSEGLQLMSEGSKYQLFVPSTLGYGARGAGGVIPPNALLIFTVELLEVR